MTSSNIVPGLLGVILSMTMVMITAVAHRQARRERGTMEMLIATPVRPFEVMLGKILPYVFVGYVQVVVVLDRRDAVSSRCRSRAALLAFCRRFNALHLRPTWRSASRSRRVARTQMQAMQLTFFFFLPSILLSGFMFPFRAMPGWAQAIGECIPLTHFLRIVREIVLKGAGFPDITADLLELLLILGVLSTLALARFRRTLD